MKKAIFIFGPQGSGKGTQAELLGADLSFRILEAGSLVREFAKGNTEAAQRVKAQIERGELIDRTVLLEIFDQALGKERRAKGLILDGFSRRAAELEHEMPLIRKAGFEPLALLITLDDEQAIERLMKRLVCTVCGWVVPPGADPVEFCARCGGRPTRRPDDTEPAIRERLKEYHRETEAVIKEFPKYGPLIAIGGQGTVRAVRDRIRAALEPHL